VHCAVSRHRISSPATSVLSAVSPTGSALVADSPSPPRVLPSHVPAARKNATFSTSLVIRRSAAAQAVSTRDWVELRRLYRVPGSFLDLTPQGPWGNPRETALLLLYWACILLATGAVSGTAAADGSGTGQTDLPAVPAEGDAGPPSPLTYASVIHDDVPVYRQPEDAHIGIPPVRFLGRGFLWVSLSDPSPIIWGKQKWYLINEDEYVRADHLRLFPQSSFQGLTDPSPPRHPSAWIIVDTRVSAAPGEYPAEDAPALSRYTLISIFETKRVDGWVWYKVGKDQWVEQRRVGVITASPRPEGVGEYEKWIDVNLFEQTLTANVGDRMVYATLISAGVSQFPTQEGLFRIWAKVKLAKMSGDEDNRHRYFLEDVPFHMYFFHSFALHAAYWHDNFGLRQSHGCINVPPIDAQWLFEWVTPATGPENWTNATKHNPGTWVWVHN
jgi:hypothetical protein